MTPDLGIALSFLSFGVVRLAFEEGAAMRKSFPIRGDF